MTREHVIKVRVSTAERETIRDRAALNGLDVSEHVRRASMSYGVTLPVVTQVDEGELVGIDDVRFGRIRRILRGLRTRRAA